MEMAILELPIPALAILGSYPPALEGPLPISKIAREAEKAIEGHPHWPDEIESLASW
jgi:hypothetical protein